MKPDFVETYGAWILAAIAIFFISREMMCWYYKINTMIGLQKRQIELLEKIAGVEPAEEKE